MFVSVSLVPSDSYAKGAKRAEAAKGDFHFSVKKASQTPYS